MKLNPLAFDDVSVLNNRLLELTSEKSKVIANNIANAETPGYTRFSYEYEKSLKSAVESGNTGAVENTTGKMEKDDSGPRRLDGNNVVAPKEMMEYTENSILRNLLMKTFSTRISILKSAISGRV